MIYVFKTSLNSKSQVKKIKSAIDRLLPNAKWNVDLEDCDKILRIDDNRENIQSEIIHLLKSCHFTCEELD